MSKFAKFVSKALIKQAKQFKVNLEDMQINVEDTTEELSADKVKEVIVKENPAIYWSDDRAEHFIMDFPFEIDGKKYWCGSTKITNDLKNMDVKIWEDVKIWSNNLKNIVKSAATVKEIEEIALNNPGIKQRLEGKEIKRVIIIKGKICNIVAI